MGMKTDREWAMDIAYWVPFAVPKRNREWVRIVKSIKSENREMIMCARQLLADGHPAKALDLLRSLSKGKP